jgi:hypothetical protein
MRFTVRWMMSGVAALGLCFFLAELVLHRSGSTVYSEQYCENKFLGLRIGMTTNEVQATIGRPLHKNSWADAGEIELWQYSESVNDGDYWRRWVFFRDGRISKIDCRFWVD